MAQDIGSSGPSLEAGSVFISYLDSLIPGFGVARTILTIFGFDLTLVLLVMSIIVGIYAISKRLNVILRYLYTSSIKVEERDPLYYKVLKYLDKQGIVLQFRNITAFTVSPNQIPAKTPVGASLKYGIQYGTFVFYFEGRLFQLYLQDEGAKLLHHNVITIRIFGLSTRPIITFLENCVTYALKESKNRTGIYIPRIDQLVSWECVSQRFKRPLESIYISKQIKDGIVKDIEVFIRNKEFYHRVGIPYRRGYLFAGPPGTGKSSLAYSLAGQFDIDIYQLSLQGIADDTLQSLFLKLPVECMILIEDIDAVGLQRESGLRPMIDTKEITTTKVVKGISDNRKGSVSLSGLLNTLDGVSAQEGRILVITTNHKEHLDEALIRPGRVDFSVDFPLLTTEMAWELFSSFYKTDGLENYQPKLAKIITENGMSPAALQSHLLSHMDDPKEAINGLYSKFEPVD